MKLIRNRFFRSRYFAFTAAVIFMATVSILAASMGDTASARIFGETEESGEGVKYITLPDFTTLAKALTPAVVNISTKSVSPWSNPNSPYGRNPFDDFFNTPGSPRETQSLGSGFIITGDGYIFTNNHVIKNATEIKVTLHNEKTYNARVIGSDPKTDLALIKIDAGDSLPTVNMGDSDYLKVGEWVLAIGNPFGLEETVTAGIVSAKGRVIGSGPYDDFIQTDASINPGNSGGPLFNIKGEVIGINTAIINRGQGIGFAIPINMAKSLYPQLKKGKVVRGWLGVVIQEITPELAKSLDLQNTTGVLIAEVMASSPAERAGLKRGDVIIEFNGKKIKKSKELPATVAMTPVGSKVNIKVLRDGKERVFPLTVGKMPSESMKASNPWEETPANPYPSPYPTPSPSPSPSKPDTTPSPGAGSQMGLTVDPITPNIARLLGLTETSGVIVTAVTRGGFAEKAGIIKGDIIREVNHKKITNVDDFKSEVSKADATGRYLFLIWRNGATVYIALNK
ncbi:MAG: DegQ family serine endoprotease [Deltaproteobacteria bacterium]|uniref:Probable periplasmic serine endoprotease DegP-like n=1 Tax=Candidatus Zymogenus saltonus TaxID=2844893 RepID=A0A9D8KDD9_9DELT|nr:DegQ family serine endoprotease [Candidatus Zymogenus saltonus]